MNAATLRFEDKLAGLLRLAEKKHNCLDYQEIMDALGDDGMDPERIDRVFQALEAGGVEIRSDSLEELLLPVEDKDGVPEAEGGCI